MDLFLSAKTVALVHLVVSAYVLFHLVLECHSRCTKRSEEFLALVFPKTLWDKRLFFIRYLFLFVCCISEYRLLFWIWLDHSFMLFGNGCCSLGVSCVWYCSYSNNWIHGLQTQPGCVTWLFGWSALFKHKFSVEIHFLSSWFCLKS